MKEVLQLNGVAEAQTGSPRQILKTAYEMRMIKDEELWLSALQSRNNVSHAYNKAIAIDIVKQTKMYYYQMFCELETEIKGKWL